MPERETPEQRRVRSLETRVKGCASALEALLAPSPIRGRGTVLADLLFRVRESSVIDGYPRGGAGETVGGGDVGDAVLGAVLAREADVCGRCTDGQVLLADGRMVQCKACGGSGRRWADPVPALVAELVEQVNIACRAVRVADARRSVVMGSAKPGRESSLADCQCCGRGVTGEGEDRLHGGFCNRCAVALSAWRKANPSTGDPAYDRQRFITWKQAQLAKTDADVQRLRVVGA